MASTTDPRARGFDATKFRDAIGFTMAMGLSETTADRPTFRWTPDKTFTIADPHGNPYDFSATPTSTTSPADVQVNCAVEFVPLARLGQGTPVGQFETPRVILTLLDTDYALVVGADQVLLGQNTYLVQYVEPPEGLFSVTVYRIHCVARSES